MTCKTNERVKRVICKNNAKNTPIYRANDLPL
ncbi:hypothetical protein YPC_3243 [Yersinia pestis biovar Medievalis str. Harbin 35]|nr:hypothetical protein YPC_3243 [Yersinia pestis biovar Medievalis str. Harbin 35]EEO77535.1 hypothetical protein YP516_1211 [Yersinia pestis Nepal516]EEO80336.1 hypothetical protein YPF_3153 [Yersinia pestis biovar Orientalis str. India 195]EEO84585.1 hypothetical protein YPH_0403 [Yersinia pestis biovar Orientalis str. PEXU2]